MTVIDRITGRLLAHAATHWPEEMRNDMTSEWHAEVHSIGTDPEHGPIARAWRRLRFGASLAVTPPDGGPPIVREALPGAARRAAPFLLLALTALMTPRLVAWLGALVESYAGTYSDAGPAAWAPWGLLAANLTAFATTTAAGVLAARHAPLSRDRAAINAVAPVLIALTAIVFIGPSGISWWLDLGEDLVFMLVPLVVVVAWGAACTALLALTRTRGPIALVLTIIGGLVVVDLAAAAYALLGGDGLDAFAIFPKSLTQSSAIISMYPSSSAMAGPAARELFALTGLALAYGFTAMRPRPRPAAAEHRAVRGYPEGVWLARAVLPVTLGVAVWSFFLPVTDVVPVWGARIAAVMLAAIAAGLSVPSGPALKAALGAAATLTSTAVATPMANEYGGNAWKPIVLASAVAGGLLAWSGAVSAARTRLPKAMRRAAPATMAAVPLSMAILASLDSDFLFWIGSPALVLLAVVVQCAAGRLRWWTLPVTAIIGVEVYPALIESARTLVTPFGTGSGGLLGDFWSATPAATVIAAVLIAIITAAVTTSRTSPRPDPAR